MLILLYVLDEIGYDSHIKNADRTYRINSDKPQAQMTDPRTPYPLAPTIKAEFAGIESAARVQRIYGAMVKLGEEYIPEFYFASADPEIFTLFAVELVKGDTAGLLKAPNSIAISEYIAEKYFPDDNPMGQKLSVLVGNQAYEFEVDAVFKNFSRKSTFFTHFLSPLHVSETFTLSFYRGMEINLSDAWHIADSWWTYVLLSENANPEDLRQILSGISQQRYRPEAATQFVLQPLEDIYFHSSHLVNNNLPKGDLNAIYVLILISVSIMVLACVNYVLLSTAQTTTRMSEIGVRKAVGANRQSIVFQVLGESVLLSALSLPIAIGLMELALSFVNELFRTNLEIDLLANWPFALGAVLITLIAGLLSGAYVAIYQSAVQPVEVLRSRPLTQAGRFSLRRILVIFQLVIFVTLLSCAELVYLQVDYAMNRDPGFDNENILLASSFHQAFASKYQSLKNEALQIPGVTAVTGAIFFPPSDSRSITRAPSAVDPTSTVLVEALTVDYDFVKTLGLTLVGGRGFSRDEDLSDNQGVILNETAVRALGYETPVGSMYNNALRIVGVVKDFNVHSVRDEIAPIAIRLNTQYLREIAVRFEPGKMAEVKQSLDQIWKKHFPDEPEGFYLYEDAIPYLYIDERRIGKIVGYATAIAVFICCMGLFGLSLFINRSRTKEIGIRKTFGASTSSVVKILVREYVWLVVVALVISIPITCYFMSGWLENYIYRIPISWYVFALSGLAALIVTIATVSIQSYRAARANPVDSIRYE